MAAVWEADGDRLLAWIEKRGTDENLIACGDAIAGDLNLDRRTAGDLALAYERSKPGSDPVVILDDGL